MADYYYEARKHDKWLRRHAKENKARKERMKEFQRAHSRDHQQSLIIEGKPCKLYRDAAAGSVEATLMPWNGRHDVLIDRFDARAVLDMVPLSPKDTGDHREKKGLETFLSFERYRGILDAQRAGLGEREHAAAVAEQVKEKLAEIARIQQGEPDAAELLAAQQAQNERNKKAETKAALKEAMNAGVHGHYGPGGAGSGTAPSRGGRGAEVPLKYGGEVVGRPKGNREAPDEDEAQLDPEILALIEKEVGGGPAAGDSDDDSSEGSDYSEDDDDEDDQEDDEGGDINGDEGATSAAHDRLGEEYGISEKRSGYSYSRLLRYERRHRAQQRAIRAEELETAKKRKKAKKKADGGGAGGDGGGHDDSLGHEGGGGRRVTGSRFRPDSSFRDSPTYEDFVDPLEARRQKRKEGRMAGEGGVGRESSGNGVGRGRQYISSFEVTDKKNGRSDSEGSLLDSDSDDEGGGSSHLALLEGFFPTLANSLRKHLQEKERREKELEAQREKDRAAEKERQLEQARRRASARRRSRSRSRSRSSSRGRSRGYGRGGSRDRGARSSGWRGRSKGKDSRSRSRSHGRGRGRSRSKDRERRKAYDRGGSRSSKGSRRDDVSAARSSSSLDGKGTTSGGGGGGSKQTKASKAEKKLTPMEMMKLRMRKALDSQIQKDKTAIAKKTNKETKMAELDRRQQRLDEEQHERLQAKAKRTACSSSPSRPSRSRSRSRSKSRPRSRSRSRSPPRSSRRSRGSNRSRSRSRSRGRAVTDSGSGRRGRSHERDRGGSGNGGGWGGDSGDSREASSRRLRKRSGFSRSRSRSRSHSVPSHRGRDRGGGGGRRRKGDNGEHYSSRDGFMKRKRSGSGSYNSNDSRADRSYDRHRGR